MQRAGDLRRSFCSFPTDPVARSTGERNPCRRSHEPSAWQPVRPCSASTFRDRSMLVRSVSTSRIKATELSRQFSESGTDLGNFASGLNQSAYVSANSAGDLFVSNSEVTSVQEYSPQGTLLMTISTPFSAWGCSRHLLREHPGCRLRLAGRFINLVHRPVPGALLQSGFGAGRFHDPGLAGEPLRHGLLLAESCENLINRR